MSIAGHRLEHPDYASALDLRDYLRSASAGRWLILSLGIVGLAASVAWLKLYPPEYVSRAVIRFIPPKVSERYVSTSGDSWAEQRTAALSQSLSSSLTARKLVEGAKLYPEMRRFVTAADLVPRFQSALSIQSVAWRGAPGARPVASIEINFRYSNPDVAKQVVQQLVETVYETNERYRGDQSLGTSQFLTDQTEAARTRLEELEADIGALRRPDRIAGDHEWALKIQNLYGVENRLGHVQSSLRAMRRDLSDKLTEIEAVELEIRRIPQVFTLHSEVLTLEGYRLKGQLHEAQVRVHLMDKRYTGSHPDLIEATKHLNEVQAQMDEQLATDVEAARSRAKRQAQVKLDLLRSDRDAMYAAIRGQETEEAGLTRKASDLRSDVYSTNEEDSDFLRLTREYAALNDHYRVLYRKEREAGIASEVDRQGQGEMVELLDPPTVPTVPVFPGAPAKLAMGTAGGIGLGILLSLLRLQLRPRLRTAHHLSFWPGAVLLADLPAGQLIEPASGFGGRQGRWLPKLTRISGMLVVVVLAALMTAGCSMSPERSKASWLKAAAAAARRGDVHREIACHRALIRLDLRDGKAHEALAGALLSIGEVEEALGHLIRAAELSPDNQRVQMDLTHLLYRIYHSDPGRSRGTLMELEEQAGLLMKRWPDQADGYRAMAAVLCERGRAGEACDLVQRGIEKTRQDHTLIVELASLRYRMGQRVEAESLLRRLTDGGSKCAQAYDLLYLQLRDRNQSDLAGEVLNRKWRVLGDADSGIQLAAHMESVGERAAMIKQVEEVNLRLGGAAETVELIGAFWASRGEHEMARRQYEMGSVRFPSQRSGFIGKLAELEVAVGKGSEALARIRAALSGAPHDTTLQAYRAALELDSPSQVKEKASRLELEMLMKRMPKSAFVRFHLGRSYMKLGDLYRAGKEFERCIRLDPNYAPGWLALAESEYRLGNPALSKSTLDNLLQRAPRYAGALLLKARVLHDLGNLKETRQTLEQAAEAGAPTAEVAAERARLRMSEGDFSGAARLLEEAIRKSGPEPRLVVALARAEEAGGNAEKALARLRAAATAQPEAREIEAALSGSLARVGRHEEAAAVYGRLAGLAPGSLEYATGLADSLAMTGKLREALVQYKRAQALPGAAAEIWVKTAAVHNELGDTQSAHEAYEAALSRDGGNPFALNNLAYLLGRSGERMDYALQLAQNARQIMPDSLEVQDTLIYVTLRMGLKQQALEILDRAAARAKPPTKAWFQSLRAQLGKGTPEEVLKRMEDARRTRRDS